MHVRPNPGQEVHALEDLEGPASDPSHRWFCDSDSQRWEVRMVQSDSPTPTLLIKFICWGVGVFEGPYAFRGGLGTLRDDELRQILLAMREDSPPG